MTLQRSVYSALVATYYLLPLSALAWIVSIVFIAVDKGDFTNTLPFAAALFGFSVIRWILTLILVKLGGAPEKDRGQ